MSDPSSFLLSSESPTEPYHNFGVSQDDDAAEHYPMESLENTNPRNGKPSYKGFLDLPGTGEYDQEERHIRGASEEPLESSPTRTLFPWSSYRYPTSTLESIIKWTRGPDIPRAYHIQSSKWLQVAPSRIIDEYLPNRRLRICALLVLYLLWGVIFLLLLRTSVIGGNGSSHGPPIRLDCTSTLWPNSTNCGLDGQGCRPFEDSSFAFICPAGCKDVKVLEPHFIGSQKINYRSLVIGGPKDPEDPTTAIYRGDSFVCAAAIHAGVVTDLAGGCGVLSRTGEQHNFPSVDAHGILSIGYPSNFPLSFTFNSSKPASSSCRDLRWIMLGVSVFFTSLISIFIASPASFFSSIFAGVFFHVALASDPPYYLDYADVVSTAFRRFLPAAFVGFVIYKYCIWWTLSDLNAPLERTVLWLGGCWVGALHNYTFDRIPISRLTPHDISQQPGAIAALLFIIGVIIIIAIGQAWCFRVEGRMPQYLLFYAAVAALLLALALIPGMNLRIHHYILALILLPGTSLQTRPSLLFQGILIGLFINGVARWGFASILQTPGQLLMDGELGSVVPQVNTPVITSNNITFTFADVSKPFDGISALVNDVQRFQAFQPDNMAFEWTRRFSDEPEFFRFGYIKLGTLGGEWYGDFTPPGVWEGDGTWNPGIA